MSPLALTMVGVGPCCLVGSSEHPASNAAGSETIRTRVMVACILDLPAERPWSVSQERHAAFPISPLGGTAVFEIRGRQLTRQRVRGRAARHRNGDDSGG